MRKQREFPFENARRVTAAEVDAARKAIEAKTGVKQPKRGRPPKGEAEFQAISIRIHPDALAWAKREGRRRKVGYQTIINEVLLKSAG